MKINTNKWNTIRYTFHSIYYDLILAVFKSERKRAIEILAAQYNDKVLIVGAGTGLDFPYFDTSHQITAIDIKSKISILRKMANAVSGALFSEINRRFSAILSATQLKVNVQLPSCFGGLFMIYCLNKRVI